MSWQAVRPKKHRLLRAAVEDAERRKVIYVADPPMAVFLADVLNGVERGEALPPPGEQHRPRRFQLIHDSGAFLVATPGTGVVYQNRSKGRLVAWAADDDTAQQSARILNHVDYPMRSAGVLIPQPGLIVEVPAELPASIVAPPST